MYHSKIWKSPKWLRWLLKLPHSDDSVSRRQSADWPHQVMCGVKLVQTASFFSSSLQKQHLVDHKEYQQKKSGEGSRPSGFADSPFLVPMPRQLIQ
jgi:hypothetical protein